MMRARVNRRYIERCANAGMGYSPALFLRSSPGYGRIPMYPFRMGSCQVR